MLLEQLMKFFVLFVLCWGVLFGTARSLISGEENQKIPVDQPFGKYEESESEEELKKWEFTPSLFGTKTVDILLDKSFDCALQQASIYASLVNNSPKCSRAPPRSLC
tara:strand:+ start:1174 stop:1494 length:321 start_codon:yes stop_codon:yes gene_type:complete